MIPPKPPAAGEGGDRARTGKREARGIDTLAVSIALCAALIVGSQLFVPPRIGLADNGDFSKVMRPAGFRALPGSYPDLYWNYFNARYRMVWPPTVKRRLESSELLFVVAARGIALAAGRRGLFDIGFLGAIHLAVLLLALASLVAAVRPLGGRVRSVAAFLLLLFFTDVSYTCAFQSFYMQTASLLFLLTTVAAVAAILARPGRHPLLFAGYGISASLFAASKTQEAVGGIVLALLSLSLARASFRRRAFAAGLAMAAAIAAVSIWRYSAEPSDRRVSLYQIVFTEILPHSPDPGGDLLGLGSTPDLARCAGTNAYWASTCLGNPEIGREFFSRVTFLSVLRLYAAHPSRAASLIRRGARELFAAPADLGQFEKSAGRGPKAHARAWVWWSGARERATRGVRLPAVLLLFGATLAVAGATYRRAPPAGRRFREALLALALVAAADFLVCVLANAHIELARHLYAVNACTDMMIAVDAAWIARTIEARRI